ncbi:MAG: FkbM family methyltransferase [Myxococcales bacterium]|nr:FkbM family methyltransferase [Myxococcales bacterium]
MSDAFRDRYLDRLIQNTTNSHEGNFAHYRFPKRPPTRVDLPACQRWTRFILEHTDEFDAARAMLEDDGSREVYDDVLQFNSLGHLRVKHARHSGEDYLGFVETLGQPGSVAPILQREFAALPTKPLHLYAIPDSELRVVCGAGFLANVIWGRQYFLERGDVRIQPESGDVVLDCGGGVGDTAVLFAECVGAQGHVYTFEFVENNLDIARMNREMNSHLEDRMTTVERAVWSRSGQAVRYNDQSVSTRVSEDGACEASTIALDDFVAENGIGRVDFIKMDVEGAEREALRGATRILREHEPRLAISAYHLLDDLYVLPQLIHEINPAYEFRLDHHTIHREETVLYGRVR